MPNRKDDNDMCTACQTSYDPSEDQCGENQRGRPCYLIEQAEDSDVSIFPDMDWLLNEDE